MCALANRKAQVLVWLPKFCPLRQEHCFRFQFFFLKLVTGGGELGGGSGRQGWVGLLSRGGTPRTFWVPRQSGVWPFLVFFFCHFCLFCHFWPFFFRRKVPELAPKSGSLGPPPGYPLGSPQVGPLGPLVWTPFPGFSRNYAVKVPAKPVRAIEPRGNSRSSNALVLSCFEVYGQLRDPGGAP